jgi:hypothetical protein
MHPHDAPFDSDSGGDLRYPSMVKIAKRHWAIQGKVASVATAFQVGRRQKM